MHCYAALRLEAGVLKIAGLDALLWRHDSVGFSLALSEQMQIRFVSGQAFVYLMFHGPF